MILYILCNISTRSRIVRTFCKSALDPWIRGAYSSSRGMRQKRSYSISPAVCNCSHNVSEVYERSMKKVEWVGSQIVTENTPEKASPRATPIALYSIKELETEALIF